MKQIKITIKNGKAAIDLSGFHGEGCGDIVKSFGGDKQLLSEENKAEFYEPAEETEREMEIL